jgi:transcription-repair coupling factor (superfamily II helicase)
MIQSRFFEYCKDEKKSSKKELKNSVEVLLCEDSKEAQSLVDVCKYFDKEYLLFPDFRATYLDDLRSYNEELFELFTALRAYYKADKKPIIISPYKTLLFPLPKAEILASQTIEFGDTLNLSKFKEQLLCWGYNFVDIVQVEGEVSFRGDIIDIFVPSTENPYRISLFDEEIEEIKPFLCESQRTQNEELTSIMISSAFYTLDSDTHEKLTQKIVNSSSNSFVQDIASLGFWYLETLAEDFLANKNVVCVKDLEIVIDNAFELNSPQVARKSFECEMWKESDTYRPLIATDIPALIKVHGHRDITIIASTEAQLKQAGLYDTTGLTIKYSPIIVNIISDTEFIVSLNKPEKKRRRRKSSILLDDLKPGDYIVHEEYGVGIFENITQAKILGGMKDFIVLKYLGDDKVLLPVENLDYIDRYIATGGSLPVIDKLGKGSFAKLKEKVKTRLFQIASEIVNTAASRALIKAPAIAYNKKEITEFQKSSGFEYTQDQEQSIDEILTNLASGHIMDRLLSGDVGFGKTEVAMNSIFSTVKAGFQAALIVPTTLLSAQHYKSILERFETLGIRMAKLDRFVSAKDKKSVLNALMSGELDLVIGTHALFGTPFKNLGLVIIDEEHKFGVKQKEKVKQMYEKVHLLSMSATPIPRSLNQALSSIKTMSQLLNAPNERIGVRTFVKAYEEKLIKEVILREIRRGGQVFYVFNSIAQMSIKEGELKALLPNLKILILHSKISAAETEKNLMKFESGDYDIMLATSIIESGIHLPNVNTILVDGADRFGIADLHQLRGRVGRGSIEGFAYFIVEDRELMTDESKKRLLALESNSFLGSGSVLAMHDLEIRGGGNLIGDAQSGHIKNIGYSLYLKMLEDAIGQLSNQQEKARIKVDIKLTISAYISDMVISEDRLRLEVYRRLSQCEEAIEIYEIEEEINDRFGTLDLPTKQFFELMVIKLLSLEKKIKTIGNYGQTISIEYQNGSKERLKSDSKDDDDVIKAVLFYLRNGKPKVL